jgi:branched-chain amino acid transport system permease protein
VLKKRSLLFMVNAASLVAGDVAPSPDSLLRLVTRPRTRRLHPLRRPTAEPGGWPPGGARLRRPTANTLGALLVLGFVAFWLAENFVRTPTIFLSLVLIGITTGCIYALLAMGYTLIYAIVDTINFAHGDVFICGAMIAASIARQGDLGDASPTRELVLLVLMLASAIGLSAAISGLIELTAFRPLRGAPRLAPLVASIGVVFILENILLVWQGNGFNTVEPVLPGGLIFRLYGFSFSWDNLIVIGLALALLVALVLVLRRTRYGKAIRATSQDREAAALVGVNVNRTILLTFVLAGALAGAAGFVYLIYETNVSWDQGFHLGLVALTAAVLGGIGSPMGAILGALVIGITEALNDGLRWHALGSDWTHSIVFVILIVILVLRPTGLVGRVEGI